MNEIIRSTRVTTTLKILQLVNDGMTVKDACDEIGLARSTFYYILNTHTVEIVEYQNVVLASNLEKLAILLSKQTEILQKVIDDGMAESTKPRDRLAIFRALEQTRTKLDEAVRLATRSHSVAPDFLRGSSLEPGISRFTASFADLPSGIDLLDSGSVG